MVDKLQFSSKDVDVSSEEILYDGFFRIKKLWLKHKRFEGGWSETLERELFDRDPVAAVLPFDPILDKVVLIEQFRAACYRDDQPWLLELVAGIIEKGESPEAMAHRETKEEAGLSIQKLHKMYEYWTSPGGSSEYLTMYCGEVDASQAGGIFGAENEMEDIKVHVMDRVEAFELLNKGQIRNAATIVALQWLNLKTSSF